jgi:dihydrofolate synthase/folylpolyglutamate synthase
MTYQEALDYLYNRLPVFHLTGASAYKPGLENTTRLLAALDNPHTRFKSVHIAGTNGKGSVSHYLAAILQQAGYKTGLYTSPHLVDFGERIRINGKMIEQHYVVDFINTYKQLTETVQPSFFELTMAMAFDYFAHENVDIAIIETGLGGRLDSTNIITPELSIITTIGVDHTEFLGNTLAQIAFEKAGIIKPGVPVVIGEMLSETKPVFEEKVAQTASRMVVAESNFNVSFLNNENGTLNFSFKNKRFSSQLTGTYQLKNLATVFAAIDQLKLKDFIITDEAVQEGLARVCDSTGLRGRWEKLSEEPLIIADTGHNVQGITALVDQLNQYSNRRKRIIIGMVNDKDIRGVLALLPGDSEYYFTNALTKRALPATELMQQAMEFHLYGNAYSTVEEAVNAARSESSPEDMILITGSNFVVGEALELFESLK